MPRALLLENIAPVAVELLASAGYEVESLRGELDEADLAAALDGVGLLGIRSKTQVTGAALERRPGLAAVGAFCVGTNQIDLGSNLVSPTVTSRRSGTFRRVPARPLTASSI